MLNEKQRQYYRLIYPDSYRPSLMLDVFAYEVEDVSEYGLKVKTDNDPVFMVNDDVMATIAFPDGKEFELSGQVVRVEQGFAGIELDSPLPGNLIRSEALYVTQNFSNSLYDPSTDT